MARKVMRSVLLVVLALAAWPAAAPAAEPPWCGTPEPDYSADVLPDGTDPADPAGSFPHIPHYAVGCTLAGHPGAAAAAGWTSTSSASRSLGRDMYGVVINRAAHARSERRDYPNWLGVRDADARETRARRSRLLDRMGDDVKVPILVQGSIHGNEYEGVDSTMRGDREVRHHAVRRPTRRSTRSSSHAILVFNPIQNPDGRVVGVRQNANGFDLNRDYMTQSQPETIASIRLMQRWLAPEMLDLHGYVDPDADRGDDQAAQPEHRVRPVAEVEPAAHRRQRGGARRDRPGRPAADQRLVPGGRPATADGARATTAHARVPTWPRAGTTGARSTARCTTSTSASTPPRSRCASDANRPATPGGGRAAAARARARSTTTVQESTFEFVVAQPRGHAPRRARDLPPRRRRRAAAGVLPGAVRARVPQLDARLPAGVRDPGRRRPAQRRRGQPPRRVAAVQRHRGRPSSSATTASAAQTFEEGSYVVWMAQPRRGLADTALSLGVDISDRIQRLYAPPAAWSHGYLWGADTVTIPDGARFSPRTDQHPAGRTGSKGSVPARQGDGYTLEIDSPTAVRALNALRPRGRRGGAGAAAFSAGPAGTALFGSRPRRRGGRSRTPASESGLTFGRLTRRAAGARADRARAAHSRCLVRQHAAGARSEPRVDQSIWVLRELGFDADADDDAAAQHAADRPARWTTT